VASAVDFLTHDLVEGQLLSDRMSAAPLTPEEVARYALQVGQVLVNAHGRGRVHGRLSPEHVLIAPDGVHLVDPAIGPGPSAPRYRSPEQVRGEEADWRSDIFSFGVLLYEMAGGQRAFSGQDAELEDAILHQTPPALGTKSPTLAAMEGVIAGCLEKELVKRRQRMQNAVIELKLMGRAQAVAPRSHPLAASGSPAIVLGRPRPGGGLRWRLMTIALSVIAVAASSVAGVLYLRQRPAPPAVKFSVAAPDHTSFPETPSVSPDGMSLAFAAVNPDGQRLLWLRSLDEMHARAIPGTEGGFAPFWSPDSEWIAFFADKAIKRVHIKNGPPEAMPETIATVSSEPGGGTWSQDGTILFAPSLNDGLYRVAASGGKVSLVLKLNAARFERAYLWPQFLPDGKHFVFFNQTDLADTTGVYAGSLHPAQSRPLFSSETNAVYSTVAGEDSCKAGYLLYMKDREDSQARPTADLMGRSFDACKLAVDGDPIRLADDIGSVRTLALAPISVSRTAVLVYQTVGAPVRQLAWLNRRGQQVGTLGSEGMWGPPRISPDGTRVVAGKLGSDGAHSDLWLFDAVGNGGRFVETPNVSEGSPVWSPDGSRIAYWSDPDGRRDLYVKPVTGGKAELLYKNPNSKYLADWSRDGRFILFDEQNPGTNRDVMALSVADKRAAGILATIRTEGYPAVSPDGRWLAYQSDESGRFEVYVQPFDGLNGGTKRHWKVSSVAGTAQAGLPRWRGDSKELFYITSTGDVMSVNVGANAGEFIFDTPTVLFQTRIMRKSWNLFDVTLDGERFMVNLPLEWSNSSAITVMTSWTQKLKS
jgi:Tol biopolymer transport system component